MRKARTYLLNGLLAIGSIAVALTLGIFLDHWLDLGLKRAVGTAFSTSIAAPEPIMYVYDNRTGWALNPRTQYHRARSGPFLQLAGMERFDTRLRINSEGFIDREHFLATPYYRIAFVGNSWVEAVQQEFGDRFTPLTEDYVFARSGNSKVVEIMNFGVANLAPAHSYGVIKDFALKYKPQEVWLFINASDLRANTPVDTPPPFGPTFEYTDEKQGELKDIRFGYVDPPAYAAWKRQQELGPLIQEAANFQKVMAHFFSEESSPLYERVWRDMRLTVSLIKKTLDRNGIRMRAVYLPTRYEVDAKFWEEFRADAAKAVGRTLPLDQALGERRYAALMKELGVDFISLTPLAREKGVKDMYADHFSRMGHHWVAEHLAKVIIETTPPTLPRRP